MSIPPRLRIGYGTPTTPASGMRPQRPRQKRAFECVVYRHNVAARTDSRNGDLASLQALDGQDGNVGYSVQLFRAEVVIPSAVQEEALRAVRQLDRRDDLKGGWSRVDNPDGTIGRRPHWAFVDPDELGAASTLVEALRAFRFEVVTDPAGAILGVELIGGTRSAGDEGHLWAALAPFVEAGGEMKWFGEDGRVWRWSFDGTGMKVAEGRLVFD